MKTFSENLAGMPGIDGIAKLELLDNNGNLVATIENKAGSQGSLRVYRYLADKQGAITPAAANEGLELYAEHTEDARLNAGKHPNIDRLLALVADNTTLTARIVNA
ncbi:hypothetical protein ANRL2_00438 [Anaerolineae bacterium]|nr:hypothetical protein ANRL2_00438 [Anaerolineae bacterium]